MKIFLSLIEREFKISMFLMNIIKRKPLIALLIMAVIFCGGIYSYANKGRIKDALFPREYTESREPEFTPLQLEVRNLRSDVSSLSGQLIQIVNEEGYTRETKYRGLRDYDLEKAQTKLLLLNKRLSQKNEWMLRSIDRDTLDSRVHVTFGNGHENFKYAIPALVISGVSEEVCRILSMRKEDFEKRKNIDRIENGIVVLKKGPSFSTITPVVTDEKVLIPSIQGCVKGDDMGNYYIQIMIEFVR